MDSSLVRRLAWLVGAVVFIDTLFYTVVSPMLPQLTHQLGMSKLAAGVLTSSYSLGMLLASLPAGALAVRIGSRTTVVLGLALLTGSTVAFAFASTVVGLDLARFAEGIGSACTWAGGLAWLTAATPPSRRGEMVGRALGASIAGAVFGPAVGSVAIAVGRPALFCSLVVIAVVLALLTLRLPREPQRSSQTVATVLRLGLRPVVLVAGWFVMLPAVASGSTSVLGPLRLHSLGASSGVIGGTFVVGAALEAFASPRVGRFSDRRGRLLPIRIGMVAVAVFVVAYAIPDLLPVVIALIVALILSLGMFWAPSMAMLADVAERLGLDAGHSAALMNLAWAGGQIIGAAGGGGAAKAVGDLPVTIAIGGLAMVSLLATLRLPAVETRAAAAAQPNAAAVSSVVACSNAAE